MISTVKQLMNTQWTDGDANCRDRCIAVVEIPM